MVWLRTWIEAMCSRILASVRGRGGFNSRQLDQGLPQVETGLDLRRQGKRLAQQLQRGRRRLVITAIQTQPLQLLDLDGGCWSTGAIRLPPQEGRIRPARPLGDQLQDRRRRARLTGLDEVDRLTGDVGAGHLREREPSVEACLLYRPRFNVNTCWAPRRSGLDSPSLTHAFGFAQPVKRLQRLPAGAGAVSQDRGSNQDETGHGESERHEELPHSEPPDQAACGAPGR